MSDSLGISATISGSVTAPTVAASAASTQTQGSVISSTTSAATLGVLHNPRVVQDPKAGFITEYLNTAGNDVLSQSPSAAAVAYLRLGLTKDGLPQLPNAPVSTEA